MDQPLLKHLAALSLAMLAITQGCSPLEDSTLELDPALRDSSLAALPASEGHPVTRYHLLESYGSYGCVSCPEAEARLSPYIHPESGDAGYDPRIIIVNYHVKFGTVTDPWITSATQARYDALGYASLPQAIMDGSNSAYGIREKDAAFRSGEYDSLVVRAGRADTTAWLELVLDSGQVHYDSAANRIAFSFEARNHNAVAMGPLDFRVLAVKNQPVRIPIYPSDWEVIVAETTDKDASGAPLSLAGLGALTAKTFSIGMTVPPEAPKHVVPPPLGVESLSDYSIILMARDRAGMVVNIRFLNYRPVFNAKG